MIKICRKMAVVVSRIELLHNLSMSKSRHVFWCHSHPEDSCRQGKNLVLLTQQEEGEGRPTTLEKGREQEQGRTHSLTHSLSNNNSMTIITQQRHVTTPQGRERHESKKLPRRRRRRRSAAAASASLLPLNSASHKAKSEEESSAMKKKKKRQQQQRRKQAARGRQVPYSL